MPSLHGGSADGNVHDNSYEKALEVPNAADAVAFLRLLIAADTFPQGGLFNGFYGISATLRYEHIWLRVLQVDDETSIPPLDVALAWLIHRQFPVSYANTCLRRCGRRYHPDREQAFAFSAVGGDAWKAAAGDEAAWPPPAPGSEYDVRDATGWNPSLSSQLGEYMSLFSWQLRSWLRPHFLDTNFLEAARQRYSRFLRMLAAFPNMPAVPTADIALLWHTHLGLSGRYTHACEALGDSASSTSSGSQSFGLWRPMYMELEAEELRHAYGETAARYQELYGEPYDGPYTAWVPHGTLHPLARAGLSPLYFALRAYEDGPGLAVEGSHPVPSSPAGRRRSIGPYTSTARTPYPASTKNSGPKSRLVGNVFDKTATTLSNNGNFLGGGRSEMEGDFGSAYAGAHALYAVWRAARTAAVFWDAKTCGGLCFGGSWSVRSGTIEQAAQALVSLVDPASSPDNYLHDFLLSVRPRPGLLQITQERMMKRQHQKEKNVSVQGGQQQAREQHRQGQEEEQKQQENEEQRQKQQSQEQVQEGEQEKEKGEKEGQTQEEQEKEGEPKQRGGAQQAAEMPQKADEQVQTQQQEEKTDPVDNGEGVGGIELTTNGDKNVMLDPAQAPPAAAAATPTSSPATATPLAAATPTSSPATATPLAAATPAAVTPASATPAATPPATLPRPFAVKPLLLSALTPSFPEPGEHLASPFGTHMFDDGDLRATLLATPALRSRTFPTHPAVARLRVDVASAAKTPRPGPSPMYSGIEFELEDAEAFLDDPAMQGLTALLRTRVAASESKETVAVSSAGGSITGADSDAGQGANGSVEQANGGGGGDGADYDLEVAPLWSILADSMYAKRLRTLYEHLWRHRAGVLQQGSK